MQYVIMALNYLYWSASSYKLYKWAGREQNVFMTGTVSTTHYELIDAVRYVYSNH